MRRRAVTLLEVLLALAVGAGVLAVGFQALAGLRRGEVESEARAAHAIGQGRLLEALLRDVRSSVEVREAGERELRIRRYRLLGGQLTLVEVVWTRETVEGRARLIRREAAGAEETFDAGELSEAGALARDLKVERVPDVLFIP